MLTERGHSVALAVQEHSDTRADQYRDWIDSPGFSLVRCPGAPHRSLGRCGVAVAQPARLRPLPAAGRAGRRPSLAGAQSSRKLREESAHRTVHDNESVAKALRGYAGRASRAPRRGVFALAERQLPIDPVYESFLREPAPDVMLVSPLSALRDTAPAGFRSPRHGVAARRPGRDAAA